MPDAAPSTPRPPPPDDLINPEQREKLLANGRRTAAGEDIDFYPVVRLHLPDAPVDFLLSELDPGEPDRAFGLMDLGLGHPELGFVSMAEIRALRGPLGLPVERDQHFVSDRTLSKYATLAKHRSRIDV